jgi:hypothetical protein
LVGRFLPAFLPGTPDLFLDNAGVESKGPKKVPLYLLLHFLV